MPGTFEECRYIGKASEVEIARAAFAIHPTEQLYETFVRAARCAAASGLENSQRSAHQAGCRAPRKKISNKA